VSLTTPPTFFSLSLSLSEDVKYLGLHLDRRLTWQNHIFTKRKHLATILTKLYWLLGRKSKLDLNNKLLIYKVAIKPIWTYGIKLWGTASTSNIEIMGLFQSKVLLHHGMSQMPLFGMAYRSQPSKKKLLASAPSTALD
jgi:hypothetical protein